MLIPPDFQVGMGLCELLRGSSTVAFFPRQKAVELFGTRLKLSANYILYKYCTVKGFDMSNFPVRTGESKILQRQPENPGRTKIVRPNLSRPDDEFGLESNRPQKFKFFTAESCSARRSIPVFAGHSCAPGGGRSNIGAEASHPPELPQSFRRVRPDCSASRKS